MDRYAFPAAEALIALLCFFLVLEPVLLPVHAAGITGQEASLQVEIFAQSDDGKSSSPVSGASLSAVQIATLRDLENSGAGPLYAVTAAADKAGITDEDLMEMDAAASSALAQKAVKAFGTGGSAEEELKNAFLRTAVSDAGGIASFGVIDREHFGIYVVFQTGKNRDAAQYLDIEPFLVQVPQPDAEKAGAWEYQVRTVPKLAKHTPVPETPGTPPETPQKPVPPDQPGKPSRPTTPTTPSKKPGKTTTTKLKGSSPVKTGDLQNPALWAGIFGAAGVLLIVFALLRKKFRRTKEEN